MSSRPEWMIKAQKEYYERVKNTDVYKNNQAKNCKKYYEANKDKIKEYNKQYYQNHKTSSIKEEYKKCQICNKIVKKTKKNKNFQTCYECHINKNSVEFDLS